MNRRSFLRICAGACAGASPALVADAAFADSYQNAVVSQLRKQGYRQINVERTLLGRVRIVAARGGGSREIILNPRTGEILRDVLLAADGGVEPRISGDDNSGSGGSGDDGSNDSDDPENDEHENENEHDNERENEGPEAGSSGSGGEKEDDDD